MTVLLRSRQSPGRIAGRRLGKKAASILRRLSLADRELSIALVGDREMRRLNARWRGVEAPTDVLSFPQGEGPGASALLGDVLLNLEEARRQAARGGESLEGILERLLIHGILHLAGYDHRRPEEARRMRRKERALARALREGEGG